MYRGLEGVAENYTSYDFTTAGHTICNVGCFYNFSNLPCRGVGTGGLKVPQPYKKYTTAPPAIQAEVY